MIRYQAPWERQTWKLTFLAVVFFAVLAALSAIALARAVVAFGFATCSF